MVVIASAENRARGTVRAGSRTSPPGTSATSSPTNAKISTIAVWPIAARSAFPASAGWPGSTSQHPADDEDEQRQQLRDRHHLDERTPGLTPRTFTVARSANSAAIRMARAGGDAAAGQSAPTEPAKALDTEATAKVAIRT